MSRRKAKRSVELSAESSRKIDDLVKEFGFPFDFILKEVIEEGAECVKEAYGKLFAYRLRRGIRKVDTKDEHKDIPREVQGQDPITFDPFLESPAPKPVEQDQVQQPVEQEGEGGIEVRPPVDVISRRRYNEEDEPDTSIHDGSEYVDVD